MNSETNFEISRNSLQDEIVHALREAIVSGKLLPGQRLIETEMAETFSVSRAPLREALRQLSADGLVQIIPRKGTFVVELSDDDIREIYSLRLALESLATEILMKDITAKQLTTLQAVIEEMEKAQRQSERWRLVGLDIRFHELICRMSGHSRLYKAWSRMGDQLRSYFAAADYLLEDTQIIHSHKQLIAAISGGDEKEAYETLRVHIVAAAERLIATGKSSEIQR